MSLFLKLVEMLTSQSEDSYRKDLERWAKTEYSKDWQYAYQFMLENSGKAPSYGVTQ